MRCFECEEGRDGREGGRDGTDGREGGEGETGWEGVMGGTGRREEANVGERKWAWEAVAYSEQGIKLWSRWPGFDWKFVSRFTLPYCRIRIILLNKGGHSWISNPMKANHGPRPENHGPRPENKSSVKWYQCKTRWSHHCHNRQFFRIENHRWFRGWVIVELSSLL